MAIKTVTDSSFQTDVLGASGPVLVDFWAEWCGPCRMIAPSLEELSNELGEKVTIAKLNIDENPEAPAKYGVRGIPTMILFFQRPRSRETIRRDTHRFYRCLGAPDRRHVMGVVVTAKLCKADSH